jgi:Domain of unknown function (DUF4410)
MFGRRRFVWTMSVFAGLALLAACTSSQSQMETGGEMLPRPQVVIVDTFAASPDEVKLYEGIPSIVEDALKGGNAPSRSQQELEVGQKVADAIAHNLVTEIQDMGLSAQRGSAVPPGMEPALLITGQLVSIDEGNRAERVVIGFGAGRSDVRVHVQVYEVTHAGRELVDQIEVDGESGLTPGMAETMGAGAVAGHLLVSAAVSGGLHVVSETMGANVVADADRSAKGIAKQLAKLFGQEGWITK